ncbi:hypothetical protein vseg_001245 [Gypsophila vaccaria]
MSENQNPATSSTSEIATPANNHHPPRRSRPRVREVSSRFMSPSIPTPKHPPFTPSEPKASAVRRSQTDLRPRYGDENRSDSMNRSSVSPVRSNRPRSVVKLFKESTRSDTPAPAAGRSFRQVSSETAASKLLRVSGIASANEKDNCSVSNDESVDEGSSMEGDCESVRSELCGGVRVTTPCSRSVEMGGNGRKGGGNEERVMRGSVKVSRSLKLPPIPPPLGGGGKGGAVVVEVKKAVRKGTCQAEDVHRLRMMHNRYLQWRFVNAKADDCMLNQREQSEKQLYSLGVKISELQDSMLSKRIEYGLLKQMKALSTVLDAQVPYLDEWSTLEDGYSSSLLELSNGLLNVLSQLPVDGNVRADMKEIEQALHSALKATEMICLQLQSFMPKAENVDSLVSDLARVYSGEVTLVDECRDLLSKTHSSQVQECSLRGQLMQLHRNKLDEPKDGQC